MFLTDFFIQDVVQADQKVEPLREVENLEEQHEKGNNIVITMFTISWIWLSHAVLVATYGSEFSCLKELFCW